MYRVVVLGVLLSALPAEAAIGDWRLNEVVTASGSGDGAARYVELTTPVDACWFPTTRLDAYDAVGHAIGSVAPYASTTCFAAGTYLVLGTTEAGQAFGFTPDVAQVPPLPADAGQLCFASSTTIYDCVRWGPITTPVHDFLGATDDTSAPAPPGGIALARTQVTHVVADDWTLEAPTPRGPNDGTPWTPPDAGPLPDARITADAGAPDAIVDARPLPDAAFPADAQNHAYLDLDPGGGACSCRSGADPGGAIPIVLVVLALLRPADRRLTRGRARTST